MRLIRPTPRPTFQSTPSARRATSGMIKLDEFTAISIHALREEGDAEVLKIDIMTRISIHALREEGDGSAKSSSLSK